MGFMENMFGSQNSKKGRFNELLQQHIRSYLSRKFYLEGKDKDYYFGKSLIDDDFTVYSINIDLSLLNDAIYTAYQMVLKQYKGNFFTNTASAGHLSINFSKSAFKIPVYSMDELWYADDEEYHFRIGYMPENVLENAIKENPERWALFLKYKDEN